MNSGLKTVLATVLLAAGVPRAVSAEVLVPCAGISNHSDPQQTGSLAWHLASAVSGDKIVLADPGPYVLQSMLTIPPGVSLQGRSQGDSCLKAEAGLLEGVMIRLNSNSALADLTVDGDHWPAHLVTGSGIAGATVARCHLRNTLSSSRKFKTPPAALRCHGLVFHQCENMTIRNNTIENIGYPTTIPLVAAGIYADDNRGLKICDNVIYNNLPSEIVVQDNTPDDVYYRK